MRDGLILFGLIIVGLFVSWFVLDRVVNVHVDKHFQTASQNRPRADFNAGKQLLYHSHSQQYSSDYHYHKPKQAQQVTPEQHRKEWMNHWARMEGHNPVH